MSDGVLGLCIFAGWLAAAGVGIHLFIRADRQRGYAPVRYPGRLCDQYDKGECPDCGHPIPVDVDAGTACLNCGFTFCYPRPTDDQSH